MEVRKPEEQERKYEVLPLINQLEIYLKGPLISRETPVQVLSEYTGIPTRVIKWWRLSEVKSHSKQWVKMAGFLWAMGLVPKEVLNRLEWEDLFKGLGTGMIEFDELLHKTQLDQKGLNRLLWGDGKMTPERMLRLEDFIKSSAYQDRLSAQLYSMENIRLKS